MITDVSTAATLQAGTALENGTRLVIRQARVADYDDATALYRAMLGESFLLAENLWAEVCSTPDSYRVLVAELEDGRVIGIASIVVSDRIRLSAGTRRRRFHLDQLIVLPEFRRQGVAQAILEQVIALARSQAPSYIIVNCDFTDVAARRTYESAGLYLVRQSSDRFEIAFSG